MTPRREDRSEPGGRAEATARLAQTRKFLEVAQLVEDAEGDLASPALKQIAPGGTKAAQGFSRLIDLRGTAHYDGIIDVTSPKLKNALRDASQLVDFAAQVLNR